MLDPSGIVPRHPILHLQNKDGESQNADIAQLLFGQALRGTSKNALMSPNRGSGRHPASGFWHSVAPERLM
jgi:hypothetical protein